MTYYTIPGLPKEQDKNLHSLLSKVANAAGITVEQIQSRSRKADIALARQVFYFVAERENYTQDEVANILSRCRTNSTNAVNKINNYISINDDKTLKILNKLNTKK
jgi:chromosomal replication initiation ATPase DnaA